MKSIMKTLAIVLTLAFTAVSCSSDNDDNNSGNASRDVKYEVSGNYTGNLDVTYTEAGGGVLNEDIASLPWTKEFTAGPNTNGVTLSIGGHGGSKDQTVTIKIFVGGKEVRNLPATANSEGIIVAVPQPYVFGM